MEESKATPKKPKAYLATFLPDEGPEFMSRAYVQMDMDMYIKDIEPKAQLWNRLMGKERFRAVAEAVIRAFEEDDADNDVATDYE